MNDSNAGHLAARSCVPCREGVPALRGEALLRLAQQIPDWDVVEEHPLLRSFNFPDFKTALDFVNRAGAIAEAEGHHPDLLLSWGRVEAKIYTHKINGLSESDFILAAKLDLAFAGEA
ncbi:MAG: 4a-hydroxytetrahydrobiopterin dehydratase [Acidobacteria bacterium]|nr:4a-hydroxytetrahydrobiopterin dehydratase [Acidobacteriota bacterium]